MLFTTQLLLQLNFSFYCSTIFSVANHNSWQISIQVKSFKKLAIKKDALLSHFYLAMSYFFNESFQFCYILYI